MYTKQNPQETANPISRLLFGYNFYNIILYVLKIIVYYLRCLL